MTDSSGEATNRIDPTHSNVIRSATGFLKDASLEELADLKIRLIEEVEKRVTAAQQTLENTRKLLDRPAVRPTDSDSSISTKENRPQKGGRAPRGRANELILAFLHDGPKNRKQIEEHIKNNGIPTISTSTWLNRLKDDKKIEFDEKSKLYKLLQTSNATDDSQQSSMAEGDLGGNGE